MNYFGLLVIMSFIVIFFVLITHTELSRRKFKYERKANAIKILHNSLSELFTNHR